MSVQLANYFSEIKHQIGDIVYLKTDIDQYEHMVTGITIRSIGVSYLLTFGCYETCHYDIEISKTKDIVKKTSN